jgi:saccharopine dehydrogenase-like NADP-dependent oxidoreductase
MSLIVVLGAGRSAGFFIDYTLDFTKQIGWNIRIVDINTSHLDSKKIDNPQLELVNGELSDDHVRLELIRGATWVVSLLPAFMHVKVAKDCLHEVCNLATASYVGEEMDSLSIKAESKGLIFLNECGLDPGIDHMSAVKIIHNIQNKGGKVLSFKSFCGGLVAEDCNNNPWGYKFSWNPRNVILAGQGTASFLNQGKLKYQPYQHVFQNPEVIVLPDGKTYEGYPNRDSIGYVEVYNLKNVETIVRGTLRYPGYCRAWNIFVHLGLTDDTYLYQLEEGTTYLEFFESFLMQNKMPIGDRIRATIGMNDYEEDAIDRVLWTGINSNEVIPLKSGSPAVILQNLLERKWKLQSTDRDLVVMQHLINYDLNGKSYEIKSSLCIEGEGDQRTAMSKTVGLPLAIALKTLITNPISEKGVIIPILPSIYEPVLKELESYGILFKEQESQIIN